MKNKLIIMLFCLAVQVALQAAQQAESQLEFEYIPEELDSSATQTPAAQEAARLHKKLKKIKKMKEKEASTLAKKLLQAIMDYDDEFDSIDPIKDLLDQRADYHLWVDRSWGSPWYYVFHGSIYPTYDKVKKLFLETEKKRKEQKAYRHRQPKARQEIAQQIFPEGIEIPGITAIISEYAYGQSPEDLPMLKTEAGPTGDKPSSCVIS